MTNDGEKIATFIAAQVKRADALLRNITDGEMSLIVYSTQQHDRGHFAWVNRMAQLDVEKHQELAKAAQVYIDWVATLGSGH